MGTARDEALEVFRQQQLAARKRVAPLIADPADGDSRLAEALELARKREAKAVERDGWLYHDGFKYPAALERERFARTREILERSSPGPDEDIGYLEMIARQAASIEMLLRGDLRGTPAPKMQAICDRLLLGTLPTVDLDAYAKRHGDYFFVQLSAGLIDFIYQAAKAVILSGKASALPNGGVSLKLDIEDVQAVLAADPAPYRLFAATLESYLFRGNPRVESHRDVSALHQLPLATLTNFNERFVLAHEYGHTLHDALDMTHPGVEFGEEYASDALAFNFVTESGDRIDSLPPNISAQGCYFVLATLGVIHEALDIVRSGAVQPDHGFLGHPPVQARIDALVRWYEHKVAQDNPMLALKAALFPAKALRFLWERMREEGVAQKWKGRTLDGIWDGA